MRKERGRSSQRVVVAAAAAAGSCFSLVAICERKSKNPTSSPPKFSVDSSAWDVMNLRPVVLIFLLLVLIITSQFEWKQQVGEAEANPIATRRRQQALLREDAVKEKIILAQEKNIQQLNVLIQSLQLQLLHCRLSNSTARTTLNHSTKDSDVDEINN
uniref:Uncharacterized protein n=1 Tax=Leersia perrieri TaxID=77586 RepID=A0A0D9W147_9ORYZ